MTEKRSGMTLDKVEKIADAEAIYNQLTDDCLAPCQTVPLIN